MKIFSIIAACLVPIALAAILFVAPTETTMGAAQRIVYIHVAVAWLGLAGFIVMAVSGGMYLRRRDLRWDDWTRAAAELGWLCSSLTLVTGSLWAHAAWGTWWTWDPRLTSSFVLWAMYSGSLLMLGGVEDPHASARMRAILVILGAVDIPLIIMATRWFRGIHPKSPQMEPTMRVILLISVISFTVFFSCLLALRRTQLRLEGRLVEVENTIENTRTSSC